MQNDKKDCLRRKKYAQSLVGVSSIWMYLRGFLCGRVVTHLFLLQGAIPPVTWVIPSYTSLRGDNVATRSRGEAARPQMCNKPQGRASPIKK